MAIATGQHTIFHNVCQGSAVCGKFYRKNIGKFCELLQMFCKAILLLEINKNLKFKKGVGIAIKSKETSSKLAI